MKEFVIEITCRNTLLVEEIWPDGDAPENPTVEDVLEVIDMCGASPLTVAHDWNLDYDLNVTEVKPGPIADLFKKHRAAGKSTDGSVSKAILDMFSMNSPPPLDPASLEILKNRAVGKSTELGQFTFDESMFDFEEEIDNG